MEGVVGLIFVGPVPAHFSFESLQRAIHGERGDGRLDVLMGKFTTKEGTGTGLEVPFQAMKKQLWPGGPLGFYI